MNINWLKTRLVNGGVKSTDSFSKARAIRISNMLSFSAFGNTIIFGGIFYYIDDIKLFYACMIIGLVYIIEIAISLYGYTTLGRQLIMITGNLAVFYFSCLFRGQTNLQLLFFSLSVIPFMYFSWEERRKYIFVSLPIILLFMGEFNQWSFFDRHDFDYSLKYIQLFSLIAPLNQIIWGFYYFLKQSVAFEEKSVEILRQMEIEHKKQIQVQKMSSLGEMAGGVSHEINNPLMVIMGMTYKLKKELGTKLPPDDTTFVAFSKIDSMVHRIAKIIRSLRSFSRNSENDPAEMTELLSIFDTTLDLCRERFSLNRISLEVNVDKDIVVFCRPTEISQVLLNLLNNAFDATCKRTEARVLITGRKVGDQIEILVQDNGSGVSPKIIDKIMQPFFTTKDIGNGTGLGLSISKGIIEGHQGTLQFIPTASITTFQILLPKTE